MQLEEVVKLIYGQVLTENVDLRAEVEGGCGPQVVRTAQMADVAAVVFVRGKMPTQDVIDLANAEQIPLITTPYGMFELCGRLYKAGLPSLERRIASSSDE